MKTSNVLALVSLILLCPGIALAQDSVTVAPTHYKVVFENPSVRVLRIDYAPGAKSVMHQHPDAIVITFGVLKVSFNTALRQVHRRGHAVRIGDLLPGWRAQPDEHGQPAKSMVSGSSSRAQRPASWSCRRHGPGWRSEVLAEGPRVTSSPFHGVAGTLGAALQTRSMTTISLSSRSAPRRSRSAIEGKTAQTTWARGDVQFIGRGVAHSAKNTGGKPTDMIIVAIKQA